MKRAVCGFLLGAMLTSCFAVFASGWDYTAVTDVFRADKPVYIEGKNINDGLYPVLNYRPDGAPYPYLYIPLATLNDLGMKTHWDDTTMIASVTRTLANEAFRNILVSGSQGVYTIAGEARVFEGHLHYEVEDGHFILQEGSATASEGAPGWGIFKIDIQIPEEDLPEYATVTLVLFEISAKDGSRINELSVPLETF